MILRPPDLSDLPAASELCLRSKAHWGYDADFMAACVAELTLRPGDLQTSRVILADDHGLVGVAQVGALEREAELLKLFVDPTRIGEGIGRRLMDWCIDTARDMGATTLRIEADPQAAAFYEWLGAMQTGVVASGSIPGRVLPVLELPVAP